METYSLLVFDFVHFCDDRDPVWLYIVDFFVYLCLRQIPFHQDLVHQVFIRHNYQVRFYMFESERSNLIVSSGLKSSYGRLTSSDNASILPVQILVIEKPFPFRQRYYMWQRSQFIQGWSGDLSQRPRECEN
jgi:hypothetical protein